MALIKGIDSICRVVLMAAVCIVMVAAAGVSYAKDDPRIDGAAQFLLDRANANYRYMFEQRLKKNEAFQLYLPTVYDYIDEYGLYQIIQSKPGMWKRAVEKDLDNLLNQYSEILKDKSAFYVINEVNKILDGFEFHQGGERCTLLGRYDISSPCLQIQVSIAQESAISFDGLLNALKSKNDLAGKIKAINDSLARLRAIVEDQNYSIQNASKFKATLSKLEEHVSNSDLENLTFPVEIVDLMSELRNAKSITEKVDFSLKIAIKMVGLFGEGAFKKRGNYEKHKEYFERYKKYAMMFAMIADADEADSVQAILTTYTLPAVSFGVKREQGRHLTITSYLGAGVGYESIDTGFGSDAMDYAKLVAPVGIEHTWGFKGGSSTSLFVSFVDFGAAVSSKIADTDHGLEIEDLFAPGIFVVWGFEEIPLAMGAGYQRSRSLENGGEYAHNVMMFFAFDMPLLVLY